MVKVYDKEGKELGQGSAFAAQGFLITNAHVVAGASWVEVLDQSGVHVSTAAYASFVDIQADLAVLPFPGQGTAGLRLASSVPEVGDDVWVFGAPLGLSSTTSKGIVSALRTEEGVDYIQTTAPISPGSSGGPLVSMSGEVQGVVVAMREDGQNLNFAVRVTQLPKLKHLSARVAFPSPEELVPVDDEKALAKLYWTLAIAEAPVVEYGTLYNGRLDEGDRVGEFYSRLVKLSGIRSQNVRVAVHSKQINTGLLLANEEYFFGGGSAWHVQDENSGIGVNPYIETTLPGSAHYYALIVSEKPGIFTLYAGNNIPSHVALEARWVYITTSEDGEWYVDQESLSRRSEWDSYYKRADEDVTLWVTQAFFEVRQEEDGPADANLIRWKLRCAARRVTMLGGGESYLGSLRNVREFPTHQQQTIEIPPGSVAEAVLSRVCSSR